MRSETPRGPKAPGRRKSWTRPNTFYGRAQSLFKKTASTIAASNPIGKLTDVYPEYKYEDMYYNGGSARNVDYNYTGQQGGLGNANIVQQAADGKC